MTAVPSAVIVALEDARLLGFLGPRPVAKQIEHAAALAKLLEANRVGPARFLDLGSGGGIPGLVLAARWSEHTAVLLDSSARRTAFLRRAIAGLGWTGRVSVVEGRGEQLARDDALRASFPLVVSRSFAAPPITAEIGGAFVAIDGILAVSEPNEQEGRGERWPTGALEVLGFAAVQVRQAPNARAALARRTEEIDDRWPRGVGVPEKRPLW